MEAARRLVRAIALMWKRVPWRVEAGALGRGEPRAWSRSVFGSPSQEGPKEVWAEWQEVGQWDSHFQSRRDCK